MLHNLGAKPVFYDDDNVCGHGDGDAHDDNACNAYAHDENDRDDDAWAGQEEIADDDEDVVAGAADSMQQLQTKANRTKWTLSSYGYGLS